MGYPTKVLDSHFYSVGGRIVKKSMAFVIFRLSFATNRANDNAK